jgi:dipeptide/tripeptide permease
LKRRLIALGLGILTLIIVFAIALLSSGDLRIIYIAGVVLLLGCAIWLGAKDKADWLAMALFLIPLFAGFSSAKASCVMADLVAVGSRRGNGSRCRPSGAYQT